MNGLPTFDADSGLAPDVLYQVLEQLPDAACLLRGPDHHIVYNNEAFARYFPGRYLRGMPLAQAQPDAIEQGFGSLLDHVYQTGEPFAGHEMPRLLAAGVGEPPQELFFDFTAQVYREAGQVAGVAVFAREVTERVLARRDAERQRSLLQTIYAEAPVPVAVFSGPDMVYEFVNPAYQRTFAGHQLVGRRLLEVLPELVSSPMPALLLAAYHSGQTQVGQEMPLWLTRGPGQAPDLIYGSFTCQPRRNAAGQVDGLIFFAVDVTPQVRARLAVERSEARFRRLAEATPMIVWEADPAGQTTYLSPNWKQFTGSPDGLGLSWQQFVHPDDQAGFLRSWQEAVRTAQPFRAEMRLRVAATGEYRWHLDQALPVRDEAGRVTQWVGAAIDIQELKRLQQTLLESEQYFRQMADHVPAMLWVTDARGRCTYLNQQWYEFTGQTEADALDYGWLRAVHPADVAATAESFNQANANQAAFRLLYRLRRHDGAYRWTLDASLPRFNAAGEYEGFVGVVLDIHERQLAEQALQRLTARLRTARDQAQTLNAELRTTNAELVRTNVDLDNFIYTASHDLKAPITNIEGLLDELQQFDPADTLVQAAPLLWMMRDATARFRRTLDHLSDLTKLQREHDQPAALVHLSAIIDDVRLDLQPLIAQARAQMDIAVDNCPPVSFSPKNLRSVVYNLLSNALKYRHPDRAPQVRLRCHTTAEYHVLTVEDNGLGLSAEQQAGLFTMFRRFHGHVEGSGIGLYMVKRSVENVGGHIEVESVPNQGTTFRVFFRR